MEIVGNSYGIVDGNSFLSRREIGGSLKGFLFRWHTFYFGIQVCSFSNKSNFNNEACRVRGPSMLPVIFESNPLPAHTKLGFTKLYLTVYNYSTGVGVRP